MGQDRDAHYWCAFGLICTNWPNRLGSPVQSCMNASVSAALQSPESPVTSLASVYPGEIRDRGSETGLAAFSAVVYKRRIARGIRGRRPDRLCLMGGIVLLIHLPSSDK